MRTQTNTKGGHAVLSWDALIAGLRDDSPSAYLAVVALVALGAGAIWAGRGAMRKT